MFRTLLIAAVIVASSTLHAAQNEGLPSFKLDWDKEWITFELSKNIEADCANDSEIKLVYKPAGYWPFNDTDAVVVKRINKESGETVEIARQKEFEVVAESIISGPDARVGFYFSSPNGFSSTFPGRLAPKTVGLAA